MGLVFERLVLVSLIRQVANNTCRHYAVSCPRHRTPGRQLIFGNEVFVFLEPCEHYAIFVFVFHLQLQVVLHIALDLVVVGQGRNLKANEAVAQLRVSVVYLQEERLE